MLKNLYRPRAYIRDFTVYWYDMNWYDNIICIFYKFQYKDTNTKCPLNISPPQYKAPKMCLQIAMITGLIFRILLYVLMALSCLKVWILSNLPNLPPNCPNRGEPSVINVWTLWLSQYSSIPWQISPPKNKQSTYLNQPSKDKVSLCQKFYISFISLVRLINI